MSIKKAFSEANHQPRQSFASFKVGPSWIVLGGISLILLAVAYSVLKADAVTLKTSGFELHTEVTPK